MITANAGARANRQEFTVEPGKPTIIDWQLAPPEEAKKGPTPAAQPVPVKQPITSRDYFQDPASWTQNGTWWVRKGGGTSWLRSNQGTFVIEFLKQSSGLIKKTKRVEWMIDQSGSGNHIDYSFDFTSLERRATVDGKTGKAAKQQVQGAGDSYTLQIEIGPDRIVIRDAQGKELDQYERPKRDEPLGKFGFKGDVALVVKRAE
jgi:hypothetical protein